MSSRMTTGPKRITHLYVAPAYEALLLGYWSPEKEMEEARKEAIRILHSENIAVHPPVRRKTTRSLSGGKTVELELVPKWRVAAMFEGPPRNPADGNMYSWLTVVWWSDELVPDVTAALAIATEHWDMSVDGAP